MERLKSEIMSLEMIMRSAGGDTQVSLVVWCIVTITFSAFFSSFSPETDFVHLNNLCSFFGLSWHLLLFFFCYIPLKGTQKQHRRQLADLLLVHQRDVLYTDRQERAYVACCMELHHMKSLFMRDATLKI